MLRMQVLLPRVRLSAEVGPMAIGPFLSLTLLLELKQVSIRKRQNEHVLVQGRPSLEP